jgi:hypothetical protein
MVINRFAFVGISLEGNGGNVVEGNLIGTDPTGPCAANGSGAIRGSSPGNRSAASPLAARKRHLRKLVAGYAIHGSTATALW